MSNAVLQGRDHGKNLNPHPVIHFLKNKDLQNSYARKQPTHFSIAPFNQKTKEKKNYLSQTNQEFFTLKKWPLNPKLKPTPIPIGNF